MLTLHVSMNTCAWTKTYKSVLIQSMAKKSSSIHLSFFVLCSLEAVGESMTLLDKVRDQLKGPVWINADILPGPGGTATPLDAQAFLQTVAMKAEGDVLSLGWTTGWSPNTDNPGKTCLFVLSSSFS